jgi:nickel/cobalt exporter
VIRRSVGRGFLAAMAVALLLPVAALAHPLGNFTINHYAGIRVRPAEVLVDAVVDMAEIPTFQARQEIDADGDGEVSAAEEGVARDTRCTDLLGSLELTVGGARQMLGLVGSDVSFPPGVSGLSTMRLVCTYRASLTAPIGQATPIGFADRSFPERIGWREVVVEGDGVTLDAPGIPTVSASARLTAYPTDLLSAPLDFGAVAFTASPGGPPAGAWSVPETGVDAAPAPGTGSVPGGVSSEVPSIFSADLTPAIALLSLATAVALGAGHALTPGHGKTLMAAYLVGTRGTAVHAIGLGLSVTVSHTIGILALAVLVVAAQSALPPDVVVRWLPLLAALTIVGIGTWMVAGEVRRRRAVPITHDHAHAHAHPHDHPHGHGGVSHSHAPAAGTTITWRSLFVLGLAGGIIPSTNALLILLGTIAAGRAPFGVVLVVAFGIGMALVLGGVGLALVFARERIDRLPADGMIGRISGVAPIAAAVLVLGLGVWLTSQAILSPPSL